MSDKYSLSCKDGIYFLTLTVTDWIDVFTRKEYCEIIIDSLEYCIQNKGLKLHAYCLMPSHLHMIASMHNGFDISDFLRDFKKFTSKEIVKAINEINESRKEWMLYRFEYAGKFLNRVKQYKFWQDGNHAIGLATAEMIEEWLTYIHENPVKAMLVYDGSEYVFSSAGSYLGKDDQIKVELLK